jgi:uncharacterized protein YecE (DUF72 family)
VSKALIGTSGYSYDHWARGVFYPSGLPRARWLEHYCEHFNTVELNVTFYRLPQEKTFAGWDQRTPSDFAFAVKGSRYITHVKRLTNLGDSLHTLAARISRLGPKCHVVLWQLPPSMNLDTERLAAFCEDARRTIPTRHVFEFRNESWLVDEVYGVLQEHGCALCLADWFEKDMRGPITADFTYLRRHGPRGRYEGDYSKKHLEKDAKDISEWLRRGIDVYVYFNNDVHGYAVKNAEALGLLLNDV